MGLVSKMRQLGSWRATKPMELGLRLLLLLTPDFSPLRLSIVTLPCVCAAADNSSTLQQSREWPVFIQQWSANYTPHWSHPGTPYMISSILAADHTNPQVTLSGQLAPLSDFEMMVYQVLLEHYLSSYQVSWFPGTINSVQCKTWQGIIIDEHTWLTPPTPHNHCNVNALSRDDQSWMN